MNITKVTDLRQLEDKNLVPELKKRLTDRRLAFITSEDCQRYLSSLNEGEIDHESASELWQPLFENAIAYLKRSDPREWAEDYGEPSTIEEKSSLKAFGVEKLNEYFVQFREFEKILYGAEKYYHEHTRHVFRVWILGALLLDDWFQDAKSPYIEFFKDVADEVVEPVGSLISDQEIQAMWCIIALSHDLGYPLQKVDSINEQTRTMLRQYAKVNLQDLNFDVPQQHQFINDFILKFISSTTMLKPELMKKKPKNKQELKKKVIQSKEPVFRTHVQSKYYLKYSKSLEDFQHGIFSAILLMRSLTYFLESDFDMDDLKPLNYDDAKQCAIRREILRAIACHTCEEIYHIRPDTLGFLLIICDELQSWGRPTFEDMQIGERRQPSAKLNKFSSQEVDCELNFPGSKDDLDARTKGLFKRFHKMLRVAVDTPEREFTCHITVKSQTGLPGEYKFGFEAQKRKPRFQFLKNGRRWNPWVARQKRSTQKQQSASPTKI